MSDIEYVKCNICGSEETDVLLKGRGQLQIVRCRGDELVYMNPRPRLCEVRTFHTEFVRPNNLEFFGDYRRDVLRREAEALKQIVPRGRLLDVGCATGTFFESFDARDWELHGVDTSGLGAELARERFGASVFCGTVKEAGFHDEFFDAVSILDALFYSPDPLADLIEYSRVLKPGGVLAIEIPGYAYSWVRNLGPVCWLMDGSWRKGFTDSHQLYFFSPRSIRRLLAAAGFRLKRVVPEQASLGRHGVARLINEAHFAFAKALFRASGGRISFAGKELYLATKETGKSRR